MSSAIRTGCGDGCGPRAISVIWCWSALHWGPVSPLQYGLDYPDEVKGLVCMTVAMRPEPRSRHLRLAAAGRRGPGAVRAMARRHAERHAACGRQFREQLIAYHEQVGPLSHHDLLVIDQFDVWQRIMP